MQCKIFCVQTLDEVFTFPASVRIVNTQIMFYLPNRRFVDLSELCIGIRKHTKQSQLNPTLIRQIHQTSLALNCNTLNQIKLFPYELILAGMSVLGLHLFHCIIGCLDCLMPDQRNGIIVVIISCLTD